MNVKKGEKLDNKDGEIVEESLAGGAGAVGQGKNGRAKRSSVLVMCFIADIKFYYR